MKSLIDALHDWCTKYPLQEKVVVVDSYAVAEQITHAYHVKGHHTINLKFNTVFDLATEMVDLYSDLDRNLLDEIVAEQMLYSVLIELKQNDSLHYFAGMEITPAFNKAIYATIKKLRMAGYTKENFPMEAFLSTEKGKDLYIILEKYEELLESKLLFDEAKMLYTALAFARKNERSLFLLQSNLQLSFLEEKLLQAVLPSNTFKLPVDQVRGIHIPERTSLSSISWGDASTLSYIYDLENATAKPDLSFFTGKTEELELKEVFARIKASNSRLDENVVYYTNPERYVTLSYHLAQKGDIPITFGEGLPISFSRPGRFVSGILNWIKTNYSVQPFLDLLQEGLISLGEGAPNPSNISGYLRALQIGWSKERYVTMIQRELRNLQSVIRNLEDSDKKEYLSKQLNDLKWLLKWFESVFKRLPHYDEQMNDQKILEGIHYLLKNHSRTNGDLHEAGRIALLETIEKVKPFANETLSTYEVFERVRDLLLSVRIYQSKPKPGHLHIASYKSGIYNARPNVFIVGLDNRSFPGGVSEDPILLDRERQKLARNIPILENSGQENLYWLLQLLAHSSGSVTVSYSSFDIIDNRAVSPAHLFLQCYRYATGNKDADFKELRNVPSALTSSVILETKDYWNQLLFDERPKHLESSLRKHFQNIDYGLMGEQCRQLTNFTEYDGLVHVDANDLDPRVNRETLVSAAKLEMIAKCPYSYFLHDVLRVRPIENIEFEPYRWLDAATRGSLLHSIFENFYKEINGEKPLQDKHQDKIEEIATKSIMKLKDEVPPPSERIFNKEVQDILECCRIFLREEELHCSSYEPLYFEYAFGLGEHRPAVVTLPSGNTIQVAGKIDRVDKSMTGHYHIIDYKTGSTYGYENKKVFKGGRQLQHMLYALAIEEHLSLERGTVRESAYYFPTVKGLAKKVVREQDEIVRTNGADILERLIDVLKTGTFTMTDDENDCRFCDFKTVCRRAFYDKETLEMKQIDKTNQELGRFKGVRAYD